MDHGNCKNMVSNLPLLFAGGYPTSLEKITESQLEKFIPFMVQCSLGFIQIPSVEEYSEPEWWPSDLEFMIPFSRPLNFNGNWLEKMRELVVICYSFHKCVFLLRFCTDLASYEPATLRFINNYNSTTSLYQRRTNKLLVTFRNENMLYDQAQQTSSRKCLLPKQASSHQLEMQQEQMVEPAFFDIYLCDDCDAELYSYDAYVEHEKVCLEAKAIREESDDDDVIFCGSEKLPTPIPACERKPITSAQHMSSFLSNFNLMSRNTPVPTHTAGGSNISKSNISLLDGSPEKLRRLPRRTRGVVTLSKCTSIPLSSPCGQFLLKSIKTVTSEDYQMERLDRLERFCAAPALLKDGVIVTNRPKWMSKSRVNTNVTISFKRASDEIEHCHSYKFPRRQFSTQCKKNNFVFYNKLLIKKCKPCAVELQRLTAQEIEDRNIDIRLKKLNITRKAEGQCQNRHVIVDCIDLCSSDEEDIGKKPRETECVDQFTIEYIDETSSLDIRQHIAEIVNPASSNTESLVDTNPFLYFAGNKSVAQNGTFPTLTPSLHLYSSVKNSTVSGSSPVFNIQSHLETTESSSDTNPLLPCIENLTEVKENRVSDWLNDTASPNDNVGHVSQQHLLFSSTASLVSRALSPSSQTNTSPISNNNGLSVVKSLPSLLKFGKNSNNSSTDTLRHRTAVVDIK